MPPSAIAAPLSARAAGSWVRRRSSLRHGSSATLFCVRLLFLVSCNMRRRRLERRSLPVRSIFVFANKESTISGNMAPLVASPALDALVRVVGQLQTGRATNVLSLKIHSSLEVQVAVVDRALLPRMPSGHAAAASAAGEEAAGVLRQQFALFAKRFGGPSARRFVR